MQPPLEHFGPSLPEGDMSTGDYLGFVVKRHKYITIVVQHRAGIKQGPHFGITLHRVEMKKLVKALHAAIDAPIDPNLELESYGGTEGVYLGGPPRADSILDPSMGIRGAQHGGSPPTTD